MFVRAFLLLAVACVQSTSRHKSGPLKLELPAKDDQRFCRGGLQISYPDVDIGSCMIIPEDLREKISQEWGPPQVLVATANKKKKYTLMMVDPDAPSRTNPTRAYWRHWLLADIDGSSLRAGNVKGTLLSEYIRPTPPKRTALHRYQFLLYEQNTGQPLSLSQPEQRSPGNWDPEAFVQKFGLVGPVASLQFLTQHFKD